MTIEGDVTPIVNTVHFHHMSCTLVSYPDSYVKTGRISLFLAAGFARVAIKELLLSGVPHRTVRLYRWASQLDQEVGFLAGSKYSRDCSYCTTNFDDGRHAKLREEKPLLLLRGQLLFGEDTYVVSSSRFVGTSKGRLWRLAAFAKSVTDGSIDIANNSKTTLHYSTINIALEALASVRLHRGLRSADLPFTINI